MFVEMVWKKMYGKSEYSVERLIDDTGEMVEWTWRHTNSIWSARERKHTIHPQFVQRIPLHISSNFYWLIRTFQGVSVAIWHSRFICYSNIQVQEPENLIYREPILNLMIRSMFNRRFRYGLPIIKRTASISFNDIDIDT